MPRYQHINVVMTYVADIEKAADFYEHVLGFGAPVMQTPQWVEFKVGNLSHIALHKSTPEQLEGVDRSKNTVKVSLVVDNLETACSNLSNKGVTIISKPDRALGFFWAEILDCEGNPIRLIELM